MYRTVVVLGWVMIVSTGGFAQTPPTRDVHDQLMQAWFPEAPGALVRDTGIRAKDVVAALERLGLDRPPRGFEQIRAALRIVQKDVHQRAEENEGIQMLSKPLDTLVTKVERLSEDESCPPEVLGPFTDPVPILTGPAGRSFVFFQHDPGNTMVLPVGRARTDAELTFLITWSIARCLAFELRAKHLKASLENAIYMDERRSFIRREGYVQYIWELGLQSRFPKAAGDGNAPWRLVLGHPEVAFPVGPVNSDFLRSLRAFGHDLGTAVKPMLNVAVIGGMRYPNAGVKDDYKKYWGWSLGAAAGPDTIGRPKWGPSLQMYYRAYSLGVSEHRLQSGKHEFYLFTTFNPARAFK